MQGAEEEEDRDKEGVKEEEKARLMWISVFLNNAGLVEKGFVAELIKKHGEVKAKIILMNLREDGFRKVKTMREALDAGGNIKPKTIINETSQSAAHQYLD